MRTKINRRKFFHTAAAIASAVTAATRDSSAEPGGAENSMFVVDADWQVRVNSGTVQANRHQFSIRERQILNVQQAVLVQVTGERVDAMPQYDPNAAPWARGYRLQKLMTYETTAADMLVPASLTLKLHPNDIDVLIPKVDYDFEPRWGTIGLRPQSRALGRPVYIDYDCGWSRIDSIVIDMKDKVTIIEGTPHPATPHPSVPDLGQTVLANIWIPGRLVKLTEDSLYPIVEPIYPVPHHPASRMAASLLPYTFTKLQRGEPVKIIAWGDSVTDGGQASDPAHQYQNVFIEKLKVRFPGSRPQLTTVAWGGRTSDSFLSEPKGSKYNFDEAVLDPKPDLVIMEFVNDAFMKPDEVEQKYSYLQKRFAEIGAEWIILTPHFVRPDWMGADSVRVLADPRPYVAAVRQFCTTHKVAIADASLRWGHLLKEGIPYTTLLCNSINHPDDRGHEIFAEALMELFA